MKHPQAFLRKIGWLTLLFLGPTSHTQASDYYVAPAGSNGNPGTFENPWATIGHAVGEIGPGDTVYVRAGSYAERVQFNQSGTSTQPIVLRNFPGEIAAIDGSTLFVAATGAPDPLVAVRDQSHIVVQGLTIRNWQSDQVDAWPVGLLVEATEDGPGCRNIELKNMSVHGVWQTYDDGVIDHSDGEGFGSDAHAIATFGRGTNTTNAVENLRILDCELHDLRLGTSEALVLNGNVTNFLVRGCTIRDSNNIAIDIIGHEGISANPTLDQARNGIVEDCEAHHISTVGNVGYRISATTYDLSAVGIYIDGGKDVTIDRCTLSHNNIGCEIASENNGKSTSRIVLKNSLLYLNTETTGLAIGGFQASGVGFVENCQVVNNTFYGNSSNNENTGYNGQILFQFAVTNCVFGNNLIVANADTGIFVGGPIEETRPSGNVFDHNLYFNPGAEDSVWTWRTMENLSFTEWIAQVAGDGESTLGKDPMFADAAAKNFHVQTNSPAKNQGTVETGWKPGDFDIDGQLRQDGVIDIGADEASGSTRPLGKTGISWTNNNMHIVVPATVAVAYQLEMTTDATTWNALLGEKVTASQREDAYSLPAPFLSAQAGFFRWRSWPLSARDRNSFPDSSE